MTIFDVLRYPISLPPTEEELNALPPDLYLQWINQSTWHDIDEESKMDTRWVSGWMTRNRDIVHLRNGIIADTELLRNIIKEYNESL